VSNRWNEHDNRFECERDLFSCRKSSHLTTELRISNALKSVNTLAQRQVETLEGAPDFTVGVQILHTFVADLLGQDSHAGHTWRNMTEAE
jgi:hypothetical protein